MCFFGDDRARRHCTTRPSYSQLRRSDAITLEEAAVEVEAEAAEEPPVEAMDGALPEASKQAASYPRRAPASPSTPARL